MESSAKILSLIARDESPTPGYHANILKNWANGDDPEMAIIAKEEKPVAEMFQRTVNEEKMWADYLFKEGSMIGLNDRLLHNYVEWIANRRMRSK